MVPGGYVTLSFADPASLESALRILGEVKSDPEQLSVDVPNDGSMASIKGLLDRLDGRSIEVDNLSIHSPDLDDVFFSLTGRAADRPGAGAEAAPEGERAAGAEPEKATIR